LMSLNFAVYAEGLTMPNAFDVELVKVACDGLWRSQSRQQHSA
jgi:hypothetical protein